MLPARGVAGFLHIHSEIDHVRQDLDVTLRLHAAAHHAECVPWLPILHDKTWNDGVKWSLARRVNIGVTRLH